MHPAATGLCVEQPAILHQADPSSRRCNPILAHRTKRGDRKCGMPERRSIEICLDTKQKMTGLEVIARLYAANEFGEAAVEIVVWNIQIAAGPRTPDIRADIKSRPVIGRRRNGSRRR